MMPPPTDNNAYLKCRVDTILSSESRDDVRTAMDELFRYLCETPQQAAPNSAKVQCAIAIDSGNECIGEILTSFFPSEWQQLITVAAYARFTDVIRMVRDMLPALLVIHSNLILMSVGESFGESIAACVAVSPGTRYVLLTGWGPDTIEEVQKAYAPLGISMDALSMPFNRAELIASLSSAAGDALPKVGYRH
jgi:hypothetical protein